MSPDVRLRPLREDEFPAWDAAHRREYLHGLVVHAGMDPAEAHAKVGRDLAALLPDGHATADVHLWAVEAGGATVGTVFLGLRDGGAWLYDITVAAGERGRGYGRAAMLALEDEVRALGLERLRLNVWGGNAVARGLYRSLGYAEDSVHMSKPL